MDPAFASYMDSRAKALLVHGMSSSLVPQFLSYGISARDLWTTIQAQLERVSTVKVACLEEELDKLLKVGFIDPMDNVTWLSPMLIMPKKTSKIID